MKIKFVCAILIIAALLCGCGAKNSTADLAPTAPPEQVHTTIQDDNNSEAEIDIVEFADDLTDVNVDKNLFDVVLTIPKDFVGETTQEELDESCAENGYKSITLNEDGSATYIMSRSQHKELMTELKQGLDEAVQNMVTSGDYPTITDIQTNDDFSEFVVTTKSTSLSFEESFASIGFYMYSGMYHVFNGTTADNVVITYINADSGEVIDTFNSSDMSGNTTETTSDNIYSTLCDIENWVIGDIWNHGYCNFYHYEESGKDYCGDPIDIDFEFSRFLTNYEKLAEHNDYINALPDDYSTLKTTWEKLCSEIENLYAYYESGVKFTGKAADTSLFVQYMGAFMEDVSNCAP